jgi:hypothetical protein
MDPAERLGEGGRVVAFVTDVEGMWERLASFARNNPLVWLDAQDRLHVRPGAVFVFGGDAIDRGPHSQRIVATLLEAQRRQPERVVLLAGNRDINKLRLPRELAGHPPARTPSELRRGPRAELLRWILTNTMGAREAFEFRRTELAAGGRASDDEAVVQSFLDDVAPGGPLRAYLERCQLAYVDAGTLFVHGGVREEALGLVPTVGRVADVRAWTERLNGWYRDQLAAFAADAHEPSGRPAWDPLLLYQAPVPGTRLNPESVVYSRLSDPLNNPHLPAPAVVAALRRAGIERLVVGHTPSGDTPSVLRQPGFELIVADNSRSRLATASQVFLRDERVDVRARAQLDDGRVVEARFALVRGEDSAPLGHRLRTGGHLVSARLTGGEFLLFRYCEEYRVEQAAAPADALRDAALVVPAGGE